MTKWFGYRIATLLLLTTLANNGYDFFQGGRIKCQ